LTQALNRVNDVLNLPAGVGLERLPAASRTDKIALKVE
jgi:hypothetical protein